MNRSMPRRALCSLLLIFLLCLALCLPLAAASGFSLDMLDETQKQQILANVSISFTRDEIQMKNKTLSSFAVAEDGRFALCFDFPDSAVGVYAADGRFLYGYIFSSSGSVAVDWWAGHVAICFVRSNLVARMDDTGNCLQMGEIRDTAENRSHWSSLRQVEKTYGDVHYRLDNPKTWWSWMSTDFKQFIRTDADGNETVLHDIGTMITFGQFFVSGFAIMVATIGLILWGKIKDRRGERRQ